MRTSRQQKKRVLIAGGAGFVGSNLTRKLLSEGYAVDCVDNLITGRIENLRDLDRHGKFEFIEGDITDSLVVSCLGKRRYADIYNLACPTGVPNIALLGEEMLLSSSIGTLNLLRIAQRSKARYLFASTAEAYGDPEVFPQTETYVGNVDPVGPRSPYEEGKRFGEALSAYYARKYLVDARIVRIFNTYGPAMSPSDRRVIPQMLSRMMEGNPVVIFGDGQQTRTFLHVDDLLRGFDIVMDKGSRGEVYNIGGDREYKIVELFEIAKAVTKSASGVEFTEHFIPDHGGRWPDTSKVRALGWHPQISLESGLEHAYTDLIGLTKAAAEVVSDRRRSPATRQLQELPNVLDHAAAWTVAGK